MSETAAVAACTASPTLICGSFSDSGVFSLGNSTSTSPSQNAMRSRKNIFAIPRASLVSGVDAPTLSHLTFVDKSQVIAWGLIRRKIIEHTFDLISRKRSIDAKLWRGAQVFHIHQFETIMMARSESRHSPSARAGRPKARRGYGVLPRDGPP